MTALSQVTRPGKQSSVRLILRGRKFWFCFLLLAFLTPVALGPSFDGRNSSAEVDEAQTLREPTAAASESEDRSLFDGRGKWTGYAR